MAWLDELFPFLLIGVGFLLLGERLYNDGVKAGRIDGVNALDAVRYDIDEMEGNNGKQ